MNDLLCRLVELESEVDYKLPPNPGEHEFLFQPGRLPILLSAPHGAAHFRNGVLKREDDYTSAIARLVAEMTGAHVLYTVRRSDTDANFDVHSPYKSDLRKIIRRYAVHFVLDIHGCAGYRDFGLALGTMHGESCPGQRGLILNTLLEMGYRLTGPWLSRLDVDRVFTAGSNHTQETITRYVSQTLRVPAAQFEINSYARIVRRQPDATEREPFEGEPEHILKTLLALKAVVIALADHFGLV